MNETTFRIMGLQTKIERNTKLSKQLKVLAGTCLFFSFCYCHGTKNIEMSETRKKAPQRKRERDQNE